MTEIVEGRNPVLEALKAGRPLTRILLDKNARRHTIIAEILYLAQKANVPVEYVDQRVIDSHSLTHSSQGMLAYTAARDYVDLADLMAIPGEKNEVPLFVVLDGIEDPQNLGAILRTAEATGVHGAVIRSRRAVGLTPAVAKASAGAVEYLPVARVANISQTIETLKKNNIWVVGIDMEGSSGYTTVDYKVATAIVVGSEGGGLSTLVKKRCDFVVSIPMKGRISSLNVSVATAVVLYEVLRQRGR